MKLAVVGAPLSGLALNHQLTDLGATLVCAARTRPLYRLYALPNTTPPKPGLLRVAQPTANGIEVEVWDLPPVAFAQFVEAIPPPLGVGTVDHDDGEPVQCFLVEAYAVAGAADITLWGGWRAYQNESQQEARAGVPSQE